MIKNDDEGSVGKDIQILGTFRGQENSDMERTLLTK